MSGTVKEAKLVANAQPSARPGVARPVALAGYFELLIAYEGR